MNLQITDERGNKIDDIAELFSIPVLFSVLDILGYVFRIVVFLWHITTILTFTILLSDKLVVTLRKFQSDDSTEPNKQEIAETSERHENNEPVHGHVDVTNEQRAQLYEEPEMITSNAMKAIMGHDPQDDKRICPFYDEKTGGCYKGNKCRLLHVSKIMGKYVRVFHWKKKSTKIPSKHFI